jgi:hypothetical protein
MISSPGAKEYKYPFESPEKESPEFVQHYRFERNHQGLGNVVIEGAQAPANTNARVERRERLGGLLNFYRRAA